MTRLFHNCMCTVCKEWVQIANLWTRRNICDDYVCHACKWKEEYPEEWERIKNVRQDNQVSSRPTEEC